MSQLKVHRVAVLSDNYCYILEDQTTRQAVLVDPPVVEPLVEVLERHGLRPVAIWITHHHHDHTGGVSELRRRYDLPVYASARDRGRVPDQTHDLKAGDQLEFAGQPVDIFEVPGHSSGHIAYYTPGHVFSGDVVFGASCGRIFEGTPAEMYASVQKIASLPEDTNIWCGHEYTLGNLKFAAGVDPTNQALQERLASASVPTVPLQVGLEKATNPFMRCHQPAIQQYAGKTDPIEVFAEVRRRKDAG